MNIYPKITITDKNATLVAEFFVPDTISGSLAGAAFVWLAPTKLINLPLQLLRKSYVFLLPVTIPQVAFANERNNGHQGADFSYQIDLLKTGENQNIILGDGFSANLSAHNSDTHAELSIHNKDGVTAGWQHKLMTSQDVSLFLKSDLAEDGTFRYGIISVDNESKMSKFFYTRRGEGPALYGSHMVQGTWFGVEIVADIPSIGKLSYCIWKFLLYLFTYILLYA